MKRFRKIQQYQQRSKISPKKLTRSCLFPDAYTGNPKLIKILGCDYLQSGKLPILGNTSIYDLYNQLKPDAIAAKFYQNMVVSVPWHYSNNLDIPNN